MSLRSLRGRSWFLLLALGFASPAFAAIDLVGATSATFSWQPASGPVSGYVVYQLCQTNGQTQKSSVTSNRVTLGSGTCSEFNLQVAAYGAAGLAVTGPLSDPSELVRFLAAAPAPEPEPEPVPGPGDGEPGPPPAVPGDFDADGRSEVLIHQPGAGTLVLTSLQRDRLVELASLPDFPPGARVVGGGDYDGDGFPDLLGLGGGQVFVRLLRGATPTGGGALADDLGASGSIEGSGDYDGDGTSDVLVRRPEQARIDVWSMAGGAIAAVDALATDPGAEWAIVGSGDHDGDGRADVLWQHSADGQLVLWRMLGRASFEAVSLPAPLGAGWDGVGVADFDGDGVSDVVWRKRDDGALAISLFRAGAIAATQRLTIVGSAPKREVVGTGDLDGDGYDDVLVRFVGKPSLKLWRMNGATLLSRTGIANLLPGWSVASTGAESPSSQRWQP